MADQCNVLMVFPRFNANSFWNYQATCEMVGARYPAAPLGLITVAAMLPETWDIRLINRNTEDLSEADIAWADMIMTGGMLPQQWDALAVVDLAHAHGKPVVVGGPGVTSTPEAVPTLRTFGWWARLRGSLTRSSRHGAREPARVRSKG